MAEMLCNAKHIAKTVAKLEWEVRITSSFETVVKKEVIVENFFAFALLR